MAGTTPNPSSGSIDKWLATWRSRPTIMVHGQWEMKHDDGELRIWLNGVSDVFQAKQERLFGDEWKPVLQLIRGKWQQA